MTPFRQDRWADDRAPVKGMVGRGAVLCRPMSCGARTGSVPSRNPSPRPRRYVGPGRGRLTNGAAHIWTAGGTIARVGLGAVTDWPADYPQARVISVCSGALLLAEAGRLTGVVP